MRKKILFLISSPILIVGLGLLAQSCLQSIVLNQGSGSSTYTGDGIVIQLTVPSGVNLGSTSLTKAEAGSEAESTINDLYIYLYTKSGSSDWSKIDTIQPDLDDLTSSEGVYTIDVVNTSVTTDFLNTSGNQLLAVVYANSGDGSAPDNISSESDFWDSGSLKPLFFSGSDVFEGNQSGGYSASVDLKRQVAKLRVRASISSDAIPSNLEIDPSSVEISVSNMVENSDISAGLDYDDPGVTSATYSTINARSASARANTLRSAKNASGSWEAGLILDSLYMHPKTASSENDAIKVNLKMTVKDPTAGTSADIEEEFYINASGSYTTSRNTIYTLDVIVQSIDGEPEVESGVSINDWNDVEIDVDVPWGEISIDRTQTVAIKGRLASNVSDSDWHSFFTVSAGQGYDTYQVSLVDGNASTSAVVGTSDVRLRVNGTIGDSNTVNVQPGSSYKVEVAAGDGFTPCYLKLHKSNGKGLTRYIPVGAAEFDLESKLTGTTDQNGFYTYSVEASGSSTLSFEAAVTWPGGNSSELLDLDIKLYTTADMTTEVSENWITLPLSDQSYTFTVAPNDGKDLSANSTVSNYDLSTRGGTESATTANCYIVNAPGTYRLPLVYGNAIKNNLNNTESYSPSVSGTYVLSNFQKHDGSNITAPAITGATEAILLWEDVENLINESSLSVSSTGSIGNLGNFNYLTFEIPQSTIAEGNAVIAVRNSSGTILWSWHIWVTAYDPYSSDEGINVITNYDYVEYHAMDRYIGACSPGSAEPRNAYVTVVPTDLSTDLDPVYVRVSQSAYSTAGDNCYYQPGRKDPFPGIRENSSWGSFRTKDTWGDYAWGINDTSGELDSETYTTYADLIKNPTTFNIYKSTSSSATGVYYNAWDATLTSVYNYSSNRNKRTVKTVYDPSPRGFCVPPIGFVFGFATEEYTGSTETKLKMRTSEDPTMNTDYIHFYASPYSTNSIVSFRAVSYRLSGQNGGLYGNYSQDTRQITFGSTQLKTLANPQIVWLVYYSEQYINWNGNPDWNNGRCIVAVKESIGTGDDEWTY